MQTKILIRPENFQMRYQQWQDKLQNLHLEMLRGSYANGVFGLGSDDLSFEKNLQYARITWSPQDIQIEDISFLLDYLKNILINHHYLMQLSDERLEVFDNGLKLTIQRHYLKPLHILPEEAVHYKNGLFGNIFLEHRFNRNLNVFCLTCNYPGNKSYESFEKLMETLLG